MSSKRTNKLQYIAGNYAAGFTASAKAKLDAEDIMVDCNILNVGQPRTDYPVSWKSYLRVITGYLKVMSRLQKNGILFLQHPFSQTLEYIKLAKRRRNKVVLLVHDLNILRDWDSSKEIEILNSADILIIHTPAMKAFLEKNNIGKEYVELECFDYLHGSKVKIPSISDGFKVAFTGNLQKSPFIDKLQLKNCKIHLYGIGIENRKVNENVEYRGCFPPEKLAENMSEHFGLVWDGESTETCSGLTGEYLKVNAPHKFSMYISAGIPVIVWDKSALAPFVQRHKIGLVVSSLEGMDEILKDIGEQEYKELSANVLEIQAKMSAGGFLKEALKKAEKIVSK